MPKFVEVVRRGANTYHVRALDGTGSYVLQCTGNQEEVHSWLAAHDYKRQSGIVLALAGVYKREGLGSAA